MLCLVGLVLVLIACGCGKAGDGKDGSEGAPGEVGTAGKEGKPGKDGTDAAKPEVKDCSVELRYPNVKTPYVMSYKLVKEASSKLWWDYKHDGKTIFSYAYEFAPGAKISYGRFVNGSLEWHLLEDDKGVVSVHYVPAKKVYSFTCK